MTNQAQKSAEKERPFDKLRTRPPMQLPPSAGARGADGSAASALLPSAARTLAVLADALRAGWAR